MTSGQVGYADAEARSARRVETGVYVVGGIVYIVVGYVVRSAVLNWVVGPLWFVLWVTTLTPVLLRLMRLPDPDQASRRPDNERADGG